MTDTASSITQLDDEDWDGLRRAEKRWEDHSKKYRDRVVKIEDERANAIRSAVLEYNKNVEPLIEEYKKSVAPFIKRLCDSSAIFEKKYKASVTKIENKRNRDICCAEKTLSRHTRDYESWMKRLETPEPIKIDVPKILKEPLTAVEI
jgi:hypothetical protein